jgi:hypothetical protein
VDQGVVETEITVSKFLQDNFDGDELENQRNKYKKFEAAWNELQSSKFLDGKMLDGGCQTVLPRDAAMPLMSEETHISFSCIGHSSAGQIVYGAVQALAKLQNDYMEATLLKASQPDCRGALRFYKTTQSAHGQEDGLTMCGTKDVQLILESELVCYEWDPYFLQLGESDFEHGKGKQTDFNWAELEMQLAMNYLFEWCVYLPHYNSYL